MGIITNKVLLYKATTLEKRGEADCDGILSTNFNVGSLLELHTGDLVVGSSTDEPAGILPGRVLSKWLPITKMSLLEDILAEDILAGLSTY